MTLLACALAFTLLAAPFVPSPPPAVAHGSFGHITVDDGLPHSYVRAIIEDRDGFMWFATARGLVRYDGAHLVVYRHDPNDPGSLLRASGRVSVYWTGAPGGSRATVDSVPGHGTRIRVRWSGKSDQAGNSGPS